MAKDPSTIQAGETIFSPGEVVDHKYRVEKLLGLGGMSAIWAGINKRTGKRVVLKVIQRALIDNEAARARFRREALAAGLINHPNVVTVFDVVEHQGHDCIVMELLVGETLAERLAHKGPLGADEAIAMLLPALRGVAAAHSHHVIHRDLKPDNIFLCTGPDGGYLTAKVLDFGISKIEEPLPELKESSSVGKLWGTPAYMAPEVVGGSRIPDRRTDVYGFGAVLYEALTGRRPFEGLEGLTLIERIISKAPEPIAQLRPDLPADVVALVERAMAKQPDRRFHSVESLIGAMEALLPPTVVPRALTPIVGIPVVSWAEFALRSSEALERQRARTPWLLAAISTTISIVLVLWTIWTRSR